MKTLHLTPRVLTLSAAVGLFSASHAHSFTPGVTCDGTAENATCALNIAPSLSLETTVGQMTDKGDLSYALGGTVTIVSGTARLPMLDADIVVDLGSSPEVYGTALVPFDQMSGMEKVTFDTLPRVAVGLMQGDTVEAVVGKPIPLNDGVSESDTTRPENVPYFVFHADAGLAMRYDFGESLKALNNASFTVPGSFSVTAIFDPADPYIYWSYDETEGIDLSGIQRTEDEGYTVYELVDDDGNVMIRYTQVDNGELFEENLITDELVIYTQDADGNYLMDGSDPENPVILDGKQFDPKNGQRHEKDDKKKDNDKEQGGGSNIGSFGISVNGWIPYTADNLDGAPADLGAFSGQLVLGGTIPMGHTGINVEGEVITYIGEHGFAMGGNGDVQWSFPGLPDFISFDIPLGDASAVTKLTDTDQLAYVSGLLKPDASFIEDYLPIMPEANAKVQGYIDSALGESFVSIEGEMGMGADTLGDWIGVDLNALQMTTAKMTVNAHGFIVTGKTASQIHPDIALSAEVNVLASMSWLTPEDITLRLSGDMNVFGVELEDVTVEINSTGMYINGAFVTPATRVEMLGQVDDRGPMLTGSGEIALDLGDVTGAIRDARNTLEAAQADVQHLQNEIVKVRATVQSERDRDTARLAEAQKALSVAQAAVNSLNSKISAEYRAINSRKAQIRSWHRWYKKAKWYQKASRYARYAYERSWRSADIARRHVTIGALKVSLSAAKLTLEGAKLTLKTVENTINTLPIDADPRIVALFAAKETANLALEAAKAPLVDVPYFDADFVGTLSLTLDVNGIRGDMNANVNGYEVLEGWVTFEPALETCVKIPTFGTACTKL